jgi:hypothetical protein
MEYHTVISISDDPSFWIDLGDGFVHSM